MSEITLKEYIDTRIKSVEDKLDNQASFSSQHFALNELAIKKAEESMLLRLEGMNQFREQLSTERMNYATKEAIESFSERIDARLKSMELSRSFSAGKLWMIMALFALVPTVLAVIALFIE